MSKIVYFQEMEMKFDLQKCKQMPFKFFLVVRIAGNTMQTSDWLVNSVKLYYTSKIDHGVSFPI